jgi:coenzyme F420-reducing hydrogenase gamma subunit
MHDLILRAKQLLTLSGPKHPRTGEYAGELGTIEDGAVAIDDGRISEVGKASEVGNEAREAPRHADVMMLSGVVTANMYHHVIDAYNQIPSPKWVIGVGDCIKNLSVFEKTYAIKGEVPFKIDYFIEGCPPTPKDIIKGILEFLKTI